MKASTIISLMALLSVTAGCGLAPIAVAPSLPVRQAAAAATAPAQPVGQPAAQTGSSTNNYPYPPGTTMLYGAVVNAKVLSRQGTSNGQPVFLVATTPNSEAHGQFPVTFWGAQGKPTPKVGDTFDGFVNYPLVKETDWKQIVPGRVPYSTSLQ